MYVHYIIVKFRLHVEFKLGPINKPGGTFVHIVLTFSAVIDSHPVMGGAGAGNAVVVMPAEVSCCCF